MHSIRISANSLPWLALFVVGMLPIVAFAESTISNGYLSKTELSAGTIVSQGTDPQVVVPANASTSNNLLGVVSASSAIAFKSTTDEVQVVSSGVATVFVSDAKGSIKAGDRITVGELSGVGVKLQGSGKMLGVAQVEFDSKSPGANVREVADTSGKKHKVAIGQIPVAINIADYNARSVENSIIPQPVQLFFNRLMERSVSPQAIIMAIILLVAGVVIAGFILYAAIKGGMESLGRNPLARRNVLWAFSQATLIAAGAILASSALAYLAMVFIL